MYEYEEESGKYRFSSTLVFAGQALAVENVEVVNPDSDLYETTRD